ncbi:MAG: response regulator [Flavobacteriales bacterium]|nr:response regulator [Flavobacteriales bacterium]
MNNKENNFSGRYILFFGIILFIVILSQLLPNFSLHDQGNRNARQLLISRQRMLMQDISGNLLKYHLHQLKGENTHEEIDFVATSIEKFVNTQLAFVNGSELYKIDGTNSDQVQKMFTNNAPNFIALRDELKLMAEGKTNLDESKLNELLARIEAYNNGITDVHTLLSQENKDHLDATVWGGWMLVLGTLVVFVFSFVFFMRPIHRKLQERNLELVALNRSLDEAIKVKDEFVANISHDLRTPLSGVLGMTELLSKTNQDEEQRKIGRSIKASAEVLLRKINDLLDFSKVSKGNLDLEINRFNLKECLEEVLDIIKPAVHAKKMEVLLEASNNLPVEIMQDEFRFRQVLRNLLDNALKFTEHGEILLRAELVSTESNLVQLRFSVKDTGSGFDNHDAEKLFQGFVPGNTLTEKKFQGSGVGLALSKEIVSRMGGRIWAESVPGKGSTFYFTIIAQQREIKSEEQDLAVSELKALVIDDNKTNLKIIVRQLSNWGIQATPFNSPDLVADILETLDRFDFCIMDMQMAEMDSTQLAKKIREKYPQREFPIILLSSTEQIFLQNESSLFTAFLTKPVKYNRLFDTIAGVMGMSSIEMSKLGTNMRAGFADAGPKGLSILIAQDNELSRAVTNRTLERMGYQCEMANTSQQVMERIKLKTYDILLMDVYAPEMDGMETTRRIQKTLTARNAPLIIGIAQNHNEQTGGLAAGMDDCITQLKIEEELQEKIHSWFDVEE